MLWYLLLALFSGLAPRGVDTVSAIAARQLSQPAPQLEDEHAIFQESRGQGSQLPNFPAELEEEEVRELKGSEVRQIVVLRTWVSFLAGFLPPSICLANPPQVLRKFSVVPVTAVSRTILHQVFLI